VISRVGRDQDYRAGPSVSCWAPFVQRWKSIYSYYGHGEYHFIGLLPIYSLGPNGSQNCDRGRPALISRLITKNHIGSLTTSPGNLLFNLWERLSSNSLNGFEDLVSSPGSRLSALGSRICLRLSFSPIPFPISVLLIRAEIPRIRTFSRFPVGYLCFLLAPRLMGLTSFPTFGDPGRGPRLEAKDCPRHRNRDQVPHRE
jgi:hypothetical protein